MDAPGSWPDILEKREWYAEAVRRKEAAVAAREAAQKAAEDAIDAEEAAYGEAGKASGALVAASLGGAPQPGEYCYGWAPSWLKDRAG